MIRIKPGISLNFNCLCCGSSNVHVQELLFQGMHILADCNCNNCKAQFYNTLPVAHDLLFPIKFEKSGQFVSYDDRAKVWLAQPLLDSISKPYYRIEAVIEKKVFHEKRDAIILNCLDSCFGHVYLKLWNAQGLLQKYPGKAIVALIPKNAEWLVPEGVAEVWTVDASLSEMNKCLANLDEFVKHQLLRFETVHLSPAYTHLNNSQIDLSLFVKRQRFDLTTFEVSVPQITFVLREDRYWHRYPVEFFLYKVCVKLKILPYLKRFFIYRQNQLVSKLAKRIGREMKDVTLFAVGLGRTGSLSSGINDYRSSKISTEVEISWCETYAKSHIVIGIHGSHMLIPTSLAAGFIELLPRYKIPHITEDVALQYTNRYTLFLGRHLDTYSSSKLIVQHVVSMVKHFPFLYKNTGEVV